MATQEKKAISAELLDELLGGRDAAEVFRSGALSGDIETAGKATLKLQGRIT